MHIGLIGGIGPAATEAYYRGLLKAASNRPLDLTIAHADVRKLVANMETGATQEQAAIFARHIDQLKDGGCEVAAVTSLGGHFCIKELEAISSLPLVNAIPALDARFREMDVKRIGLLGSKPVMRSRLYGGMSIEVVAPPPEEIDAVHATYIEMMIALQATDAHKRFFHTAGQKLHEEQGAEIVVLAGTDLFLAFDGVDCGYPIIDAANVHIAAIARAAL
jgi:aspartate racemase